jgi:hypothetical protein
MQNIIFISEGNTWSGWGTRHGRPEGQEGTDKHNKMMPRRASYFIVLNDETNVITGRPFSEAQRALVRPALEYSNR